ncbi:MAG: DciA family protein [Xanthobacteraceae bacterium]
MNKPARSRAKPLADLVSSALQSAFARQGFAAVDIVVHWEDIVGPELAGRTEPVRLVWPRRDDPLSTGTLTVRVEGAYAIELQHLTPVVIERVNRYFGWRCVGRIAIRQGPVARRAKAPDLPLEPAAETMAEVERGLGNFEDKGLKSALARLGALVRSGVTRA